jgi:hypothetical protein
MGFIDAHDWRNRQQSRPLGVMRTKGALSVVARYGIIAALLSVLGTPQLGLAGDVTGQAATYPVGSQSYDIAPGPASTADMAFTPVPGLDLIKVGSRGPATASFSASLSGAPVDIRVIRDARARRSSHRNDSIQLQFRCGSIRAQRVSHVPRRVALTSRTASHYGEGIADR